MNKLIILIIIILTLAVGIGAYFIFQKPAFPEPQKPPDSPFGMHTAATRPYLKPDKKPTRFLSV